jgi:predicted nucleic acid-binding protein
VERTSQGRILLIADTSFLVNFLALDRMDILRGLQAYVFYAPNHVIAEVAYAEQQRRLSAALAEGIVTELEITNLAEIALYDALRRFLGDGEAACLAVAATRRWVIATDERFSSDSVRSTCLTPLAPLSRLYVLGSSRFQRLRQSVGSLPATAS